MIGNIYVVGCGGIGGALINMLPQTLASLALDNLAYISKESAANTMQDPVSYSIMPILNKLVLIDGDTFDAHNGLRQAGTVGSKLVTQMANIRRQEAWSVWQNTVPLVGFNNYVTPANISNIFNEPNKDLTSVIFLCVDNHKTRYEIARYAELLDNVLLINGGNSKTAGNVIIYERRNNEALDPTFYEVYPEIAAGTDKRPDEVSCTQVAPENDQVCVVNTMIAAIMLARFSYWYRNGSLEEKTPRKDANGNHIMVRKNEVVVDLNRCSMLTLNRQKTERN